MLVHAENIRHFEVMKGPHREDGFEEYKKLDLLLEVKVTHQLYQYGIEIKIGSMTNDGSQSWIVISRREIYSLRRYGYQ